MPEPVNIRNNFGLDIACGLADGFSSINKFGANLVSTAGSTLEVWDGQIAYTFPTTADITHISQSVDQAALRGGTIEVQGLDTNFDAVTQNVTLDATLTTTAVVLTTALKRVFRMKVLANVVSASNISVHNAGDTINYATISAGNNQTLMAIYTVPAGYTGYLSRYYGDVLEDVAATKDPDATEFKLWFADRANGYEFQLKHVRGIPKGVPGFLHEFATPLKITEKTDVKITTLCSGRNGNLHAGFDIILKKN